jgi:hypothetical protein
LVTEFFDAITVALHDTFGDNYKYYLEIVEQNAKKPCFVVDAISPLIRSAGLRKYDFIIPIVVHYFTDAPDTQSAKRDSYDVGEKIMDALEYLKVKDITVRGEDISMELVEGVLQFYITYRLTGITTPEVIYMEEGSYNGWPIPAP